MIRFTSLFTFIALLFCSIQLTAQKAINIDVSTSDDKMIIAYDLDGKSDEVYKVELVFKSEDGTIIQPKSLKGDYGKVESGEGKAIIWEVYKDYDELSGKMDPVILVNEIAKKKPKVATQPTPKPPAPTVDPNSKKTNKKPNDLFDNLFKTYRYGFKVGLGKSNVESNVRRNDFDERFSWELGGFFRWNFARRMYLQPELLYHQHTYEETFSYDLIDPSQSSLSRNHYGRAQVIAGVAPFGAGLYFNAGLYYGQLLGGKEKVFLTDQTIETSFVDIDAMNGIDTPYRNDAGYIIGGNLSLFKGGFSIGALFSRGFYSYIDPDYYGGSENYKDWKKTNYSWHFFISKSL